MKNEVIKILEQNSKECIQVAVICPSYRYFLNFVREFEKDGEIYTWVCCIDNVRGKLFDRVEKIFNYYELKDIDAVMYSLETRLRSNLHKLTKIFTNFTTNDDNN